MPRKRNRKLPFAGLRRVPRLLKIGPNKYIGNPEYATMRRERWAAFLLTPYGKQVIAGITAYKRFELGEHVRLGKLERKLIASLKPIVRKIMNYMQEMDFALGHRKYEEINYFS